MFNLTAKYKVIPFSVSRLSCFKTLYQNYSTNQVTEAEQKLKDILKKGFPAAKTIEVVDISGGCGAMYDISVETMEFKGLTIIKQHRLINECLKEQIKDMHGLRIHTNVPKD